MQPHCNPKCYWTGRNVREERRDLSLMGDYIMRFEACVTGNFYCTQKKKRRSLNGQKKKKKKEEDHY